MWGMIVVQEPPTEDKAAHMLDLIGGRLTYRWLLRFDPDAFGGRGWIECTDDPAQAMRFEDVEAVITCWKTQSRAVPLRDDGRPNRPLTAYTIQPTRLP
jgi:hypothetical protein